MLWMGINQPADGTLSSSFSDPSTLFTFHGYDSRGNQANPIDSNSDNRSSPAIGTGYHTTIMVIDCAGRQLRTLENLRAGGGGANEITNTVVTQQSFDGNGNQVRPVDNNGGTTVLAYDSHGRKITETYQDGARPSSDEQLFVAPPRERRQVGPWRKWSGVLTGPRA
ncbi:MAG: hypothetical protein HKL95_04205, partial [Phycisphaerae bacterium]|nr:hypothetical protein [Phycisphaerae bacterium]